MLLTNAHAVRYRLTCITIAKESYGMGSSVLDKNGKINSREIIRGHQKHLETS